MSDADIVRFIYREARLLDEQQWDGWYDLFTEDAYYWVPLTRNQPDGDNHTSLAYEDKFLLRLRIERLRRNPPSQQPKTFCQHVLQAPEVETTGQDTWRARTPFFYAECRGDQMITLTGTAWHDIVVQDSMFRIRLKRIELLNCDAALPSIQLFP